MKKAVTFIATLFLFLIAPVIALAAPSVTQINATTFQLSGIPDNYACSNLDPNNGVIIATANTNTGWHGHSGDCAQDAQGVETVTIPVWNDSGQPANGEPIVIVLNNPNLPNYFVADYAKPFIYSDFQITPTPTPYTFKTSFTGHIPDNGLIVAKTGSVPYYVQLLNTQTAQPVTSASLSFVPGGLDLGVTDLSGTVMGRLPIIGSSEDSTGVFTIGANIQGKVVTSDPATFYKGTLDSMFSMQLSQAEANAYSFEKVKQVFDPASQLPCPNGSMICEYVNVLDMIVNIIGLTHDYNPQANDNLAYSIVKYDVTGIPSAYWFHPTIQRGSQFLMDDQFWSEDRSVFPTSYLSRNTLVIEMASPVTLLIKDPQGREAGYDPQSKQYKSDFPVYISKTGAEPYMLYVPNPQPGTYSLSVMGTAEGQYTMTTYSIDDKGNGTNHSVIQGHTALGNTDTYRLVLPTDTGQDVQVVRYNFGGFLQPVNDTGHQQECGTSCTISIFKGGSTVPVKFQIKDANGNVIQSATPPQWITPQKGNAITDNVNESDFTDPTDSGTTYNWDGQQYHYNWNTKNVSPGYYYKIGVKLDDGQTYTVNVGLK